MVARHKMVGALAILIGACTLEGAAGFSLPASGLGVSGRGASGFGSNVLGLSGVTSLLRRRGAFSPSIGGEMPVVLPEGGHPGQLSGRRGLAAPLQATQATDEEFKEMVLEGSSSDVIIVVFWAPWCGPCRMLKPVLEEMEAEYSSKIKVVQLNTDEHQAAATEFGVRSIPTTMLFKGGQRLDMAIGAVPKSTLEQMIVKRI